MATYSLALTGIQADPNGASVVMDDTYASAQALAMRNGTAFLCKGPDGITKYYVFDAERSRPGKPVLRSLY